jgi:hypothetical protein
MIMQRVEIINMSEYLRHTPEQSAESLDVAQEQERNLERLREAAEHAPEQSPEALAELQQNVEQQAVSGKEVTIGERESTGNSTRPSGVHQTLKNNAYAHTLSRVRSRLSLPERGFSKVMHQPVVESFSNTGAKTLARPSGVLGGGFLALIGSSYLLYAAKHYGYRYNFFVFFLLFVIGFAAGIILEGIVRLIRRK